MRNWFRGLKLNQKFTVTTLIFIFIPLFGMMCFGFRSIKKNAIDHGVNEAVTAIDLTCAEVNAKANACSMVVDTLQEYEPLEKYLLHLRRGEEISESYYQQFRNNSISIIDKMQEAMPDLYQIHIFAMADGFLEQQPILYQKEKMKNCAWYRSYQGGGQWFFDIQEKNIISGTKKEGSHLMTYVRELRDQSGGRLGVIEVSMRMADIFPEIYRSGDSSWACFVDENWNLYDCGKTAAACKWQSYRGLILFRAGIRDRKESQQSAVIDRKNVAIVLRKVDKLNGMFVTLTNLDDAAWGVVFPAGSLAPSGVKLIPTQLISSGADFLNMAFLMIIAAKFSYTAVMKRKADGKETTGKHMAAGNIGFLYCITYGLGRFAIEFLRNDYRGEVGIFSTSQFISLFIVLLGVVAMAVNHKLKNADR